MEEVAWPSQNQDSVYLPWCLPLLFQLWGSLAMEAQSRGPEPPGRARIASWTSAGAPEAPPAPPTRVPLRRARNQHPFSSREFKHLTAYSPLILNMAQSPGAPSDWKTEAMCPDSAETPKNTRGPPEVPSYSHFPTLLWHTAHPQLCHCSVGDPRQAPALSIPLPPHLCHPGAASPFQET